ncbi:Na+/H+ antiporter subunit D [Ammoniphilus sp. CFH 90114]|uniref:Na+/H+ antiporter subunit D n=1 Tax=Ammoniphilus sp. CFH 90114 TaxID=2493665 RepID=UPI00100EDD99|nr:Na+/H+ antiporter subunit D [Ammoniphilus sp. CFH 90114]RXT08740.1 Na+/H+ antiporter subunit D [Ammoniphilus sp. CFH 90114]
MNNLIVLPIVLPIMTGIILIFFSKHIVVQRWLSLISLLAFIGIASSIVQQVYTEGIQTLYMGGWLPPFGIVFVADMFASLLVLTSGIVALSCLWFSFRGIGLDREKYYYYPFFQFLLTGVSGSFLTGDIFNLFVFFEVMLISSYALIVLGATKIQLRETIKYLVVNIVSSALFVASVAYLYAITGTLNMADLSVRVAEVGQTGLLNVVALMFLIVFSLKAGLFLYFWLPGSYSAPPTSIAAIFAGLLTKVGIYALFRTFTLIFYHQPEVTHQIIGWMAGATMILGAIGAIAFSDVRQVLAYNVVIAVGFIVFGLAAHTTAAVEGAIFYLINDMIIKALLFLLGGAMIGIAGTSHLQKMGGLIKYHPVLGWMFFIAAIALAGVPPLSGFIGKLLIVQGGLTAEMYWLVGISLATSLIVLYSIMKVFMHGFWGETKLSPKEEKGSDKGLLAPCAVLVFLSFALGLGADFFYPYIEIAAETLMDPTIYIQAVLKE